MNATTRPTDAETKALVSSVLAGLTDLACGIVAPEYVRLISGSRALSGRAERASDAPLARELAPTYHLDGAHVSWRGDLATIRGEVSTQHADGRVEHSALHMSARHDGCWHVQSFSLRPAAGAQREPSAELFR
ncbi:hypothetical protein SAMN02910418_02100 [Bowdeniella nasicola]|uniref:DUF4440 domain-containing protein n=1 Tax=Bowdeniella nasicola TaxID=208480 RepID=A0A1H4CYZ8_9ACTO|nr:hypothetical protein SAMN02910418_02100 [Bowdeniella nasicola]